MGHQHRTIEEDEVDLRYLTDPNSPGNIRNRAYGDPGRYGDYVPDAPACASRHYNWTLYVCPGAEPCRACKKPDDFHTGSIVVAVDGACRRNGSADAKAATGIFFHANSRYNSASGIPGVVQTSQRAELCAGLEALRTVSRIQRLNLPEYDRSEPFNPEVFLNHVLIKGDSEYLVEGMTKWVYKWKTNGYLTARGTPVVNDDLFRALDEQIALNQRKVHVQFWRVPRAQNQWADYLANGRLDGLIAKQALNRLRPQINHTN